MSVHYPTLLSPIRLGRHEIRNRVWMAAHATLLVKDHLFTQAHLDYYAERARNGVGIITMEAMAVHPTTQPYKGKAFAFDPRNPNAGYRYLPPPQPVKAASGTAAKPADKAAR